MKRPRRSGKQKEPYTGTQGLEVLKIYFHHWVLGAENDYDILEDTWKHRNICTKFYAWVTEHIQCVVSEIHVQTPMQLIITTATTFLLTRKYPDLIYSIGMDGGPHHVCIDEILSMTIVVEQWLGTPGRSCIICHFVMARDGPAFCSHGMAFKNVPLCLCIDRPALLAQQDEPDKMLRFIPFTYKVNP